jgi:hypothetical protein
MRLLFYNRFAAKTVARPPMFTAAQLAGDALVAARLATCGPCQFNVGGVCKQCCGGVPIPTLVKLTASRCGRNLWKA